MYLYIYRHARGRDYYSMRDSLSVELVISYNCDRKVNFLYVCVSNVLEYKYNLCSRKHLDYATIHAGKSVQFPVYRFSPDPRPLSAPVGDYQTHDFTEMKRLEKEKERNKVLEETSQLEQM